MEDLRIRNSVYQALDQLPDSVWDLILRQIQPLNQFLGNVLMDDPTPNSNLNDAITKELKRLEQK